MMLSTHTSGEFADLEAAVRIVEACLEHNLVKDCYKAADKLSKNQTKHDISHAHEVLALGLKVLEIVRDRCHEQFDEWTSKVVLPLGLFLHDIGRAIDVDKHDLAGATWVHENLPLIKDPKTKKALPPQIITRIAKLVVNHRSSRYINVPFEDKALDIVIIADKCVGDEARVRWQRRLLYRGLTAIGQPKIGDVFREGGVHDRVNYAIKEPTIGLDNNNLVLSMRIDTRVCQPQEIYSLYSDRYHCCVLAAAQLGFGFELEFNWVRHSEVEPGDWRPNKKVSRWTSVRQDAV